MRSIFVSIANYRDSECQHTVRSLYEMASGQYKINVGIGWQLSSDDRHMMPPSLGKYNIRNLYVPHTESEGCCWIRNRIYNELYCGESYILCIDSHSRFVKNWDSKLVDILKRQGKRSIISTYPNSYEPPDTILTTVPFSIQTHGKNSSGIPLLSPKECGNLPKENYFIAGGFLFSYGNVLQEIPYDKYIYFFGEEPTFSLRAFTKGWKVFVPGCVIMYHYYTRSDSPKHWTDNNISTRERLSIDRVLHIMGLKETSGEALKEIDIYGIGNERSRDEWYNLIGYNKLEIMT